MISNARCAAFLLLLSPFDGAVYLQPVLFVLCWPCKGWEAQVSVGCVNLVGSQSPFCRGSWLIGPARHQQMRPVAEEVPCLGDLFLGVCT